jgi:hypothetical protein
MNMADSDLVTIDTGFRPTVAHDSALVLQRMGITDIQFVDKYRITSNEDYVEVGKLIVTAAGAVGQIQDAYKQVKATAHAAHAKICGNEKADLAPWVKIREVGDREIKAWNRKKEQERREAEERQRREDAERERAARAEADRIAREAQEAALALKRAGDVRRARETVQAAQETAQAVILEAQALSEVGMIIPDNKPKVAGLGESRPWTGVVDDAMALIKAVASGKVPLMHEVSKRGGGTEMVPIIEVNSAVVTYLAKRLQSEDIGLPGCRGEQDFGLRVSKRGAAEPRATVVKEDWE